MYQLPAPWESPDLYVLTMCLLLAIAGIQAVAAGVDGSQRSRLGSTWAFFVVVALALFAGRMPTMLFGDALNADEAQVLTQAMLIVHHPVPWKSYDPNSAGPFDSAVLAIPSLLGVTPGYFSTRLIAAAIVLGLLFGIYWTIRQAYGEMPARLAVLPGLAFFSLVTTFDYSAYGTELLPIMQSALATGLGLSAVLPGARKRNAKLFLAAILVSAEPFSKLQAAPLAAVSAGALLVAALRTAGSRREALASAGWIAAGLALVPIAILTPVEIAGAFRDFAISYLIFPTYYVKENCCHPLGPAYFLGDESVRTFLLSCLSVVFVAALVTAAALRRAGRRVGSRPEQLWLPAYFLALTATAVYAIDKPQTLIPHYVLLLTFPLSGLAGCSIGLATQSLLQGGRPAVRRAAVLALSFCIALVTLGRPLVARAIEGNGFVPTPQAADPMETQVSQMLHEHVASGDRMAIWGWMPQFFVMTKTLPGTRDTITEFQIDDREYRQYYRDRYVADMLSNRPEFFLDAVAPGSFGYKDRATEGFETFPALDALIERSYHLVDTADGVRLYQRNS